MKKTKKGPSFPCPSPTFPFYFSLFFFLLSLLYTSDYFRTTGILNMRRRMMVEVMTLTMINISALEFPLP